MDKFTEAMTKSMESKEAPETENESEDKDDSEMSDLMAKVRGKLAELSSLVDDLSKCC